MLHNLYLICQKWNYIIEAFILRCVYTMFYAHVHVSWEGMRCGAFYVHDKTFITTLDTLTPFVFSTIYWFVFKGFVEAIEKFFRFSGKYYSKCKCYSNWLITEIYFWLMPYRPNAFQLKYHLIAEPSWKTNSILFRDRYISSHSVQ